MSQLVLKTKTKNNFYHMLFSVIFLHVHINAATAQVSNPAAFFSRCYSSMTGNKVSLNNPLLIDSIKKNDHKVSLTNCMKIFDKGRLRINDTAPVAAGLPSGSNLVDSTDMESVAVLNHFFHVYNSIWEEKSFSNIPQTYSGAPAKQVDASEDTLFFLKATFQGNPANSTQQFQNQTDIDYALSSGHSLMGRRILPTKNAHSENICRAYGGSCDFDPQAGFTELKYTTILPEGLTPAEQIAWQTAKDCQLSGKSGCSFRLWRSLPNWNWHNGMGSSPGTSYLTGIKTFPKAHTTYFTLNGTAVNPSATENISGKGLTYLPRNRGGGMLGTMSFMLKNAQYDDNTNGAIEVRRRIIKNTFSALLCRDAPPMRLDHSTVLQRVSDYASKPFGMPYRLPFRESALCASCHVSYDEAAAVYRNSYVVGVRANGVDWNSDGVDHTGNTLAMDTMAVMGLYNVSPTTAIPNPHLVNGTAFSNATHGMYNSETFRKSDPKGALNFQDWRGETVQIPLNATSTNGVVAADAGIQELGEAITQTDQFYACFVKRMFHHFTGIDVSLEDHGDSRSSELESSQVYYRDKYIVPIALGSADFSGFKNHKSVRRLVYDIINTDLYKSVSLRDKKQ